MDVIQVNNVIQRKFDLKDFLTEDLEIANFHKKPK